MAQMITPGLVKELLRPGMGIPVRQGDTVTVECTGYVKFSNTRQPDTDSVKCSALDKQQKDRQTPFSQMHWVHSLCGTSFIKVEPRVW